MKFDIYNITTKQNENGVFANNPQELIQLYKMTDEDIQITKIYNENPINDIGLNKIVSEENIKPNPPLKIPNNVLVNSQTPDILPTIITNAIKYFTDNGVEYKIDDTGSYKKSWVDADQTLFRIVNTDNGKEIKMTNKKIQILDWVKIGN